MSEDCEVQFLTEEDACNCETITLKEIEAKILKAEAEAREGDDRPRGRMKDCFFTVGCSRGWTARGNVTGSTFFAYGVAKAMADAHQAETGHSSGIISIRCIGV